MYKQRLTPQQALPKARQYCAYQERCHKEVRDKLYGYGLYKTDVEILLTQLIEDNYLDEERFAIQFAGGKFRIKQWGHKKIEAELKLRQISAYCIKKALKEISTEDYQKTLERIAEKKWLLLKGEQYIVKQVKMRDYLSRKGYEQNLISQQIALLIAQDKK